MVPAARGKVRDRPGLCVLLPDFGLPRRFPPAPLAAAQLTDRRRHADLVAVGNLKN
jgi:hypothetical protein